MGKILHQNFQHHWKNIRRRTCDPDQRSEDAVDDHEDVELTVRDVQAVEDGKDAAREGRDERVASWPCSQDPLLVRNA